MIATLGSRVRLWMPETTGENAYARTPATTKGPMMPRASQRRATTNAARTRRRTDGSDQAMPRRSGAGATTGAAGSTESRLAAISLSSSIRPLLTRTGPLA
jgi:hypothetical protein